MKLCFETGDQVVNKVAPENWGYGTVKNVRGDNVEVEWFDGVAAVHSHDDLAPRTFHLSDCALHNEPAYPAGPCDCGAVVSLAAAKEEQGRVLTDDEIERIADECFGNMLNRIKHEPLIELEQRAAKSTTSMYRAALRYARDNSYLAPAKGLDAVSDAELDLQFRGTNFGGADHREVLAECLRSTAKGYAVGSTIRHIATNLGLIELHGHDVQRITDKGLRYLTGAKGLDVEGVMRALDNVGRHEGWGLVTVAKGALRKALEDLAGQ